MSDMERLTIKETDYCDIVCGATCSDEMKSHCNDRNVYAKLRHYEDLVEQGRLIVLPCPIGTTVYNTRWWDDTYKQVKVNGETYLRLVRKHKVSKDTFDYHDIKDFGKEVFLTKAEAEAKLKELEGGVE